MSCLSVPAAELTEALSTLSAVQPLSAVIPNPLAAAPAPLVAAPGPPAAALPNSKPVNYTLVNQPETAESRELLRNMAAALTTKGDGGAKALPGHYELGITPGLGGEQPDLLIRR